MIDTNNPADELRFIRMPDVKLITGVSRPTIYRLIERGEFPKPIRQGCTSAWPKHEVEAYAKAKMAAR